ncbi:MAG: Spy/CpxP family protein refolding chaperone [Thiobacillus sp.]
MKLIPGSVTKRALMVGLIAGSGILAASSYAMTAGDTGKPGCEARHGQTAHGNREEYRARHLSELKEKLKLTPEQAAAWDTFASASEPAMRQGADRKAMRGEFDTLSTPQRLDKMLAMSEVRHAGMVERTQAIKRFYAQLSPEQQAVFDAEAMPGRHRGHGQHHHPS